MGDKGKDNECIQVVVRCRPFNKKEKDQGCGSIIDIFSEERQVAIKDPSSSSSSQPKSFTFDGAYDENSQQRVFYDESCFGLVESVLEGFNCTIFAYGQTGCGKSFTMQGPPSGGDMKGVIPNAFSHIFEFVKGSKDIEFLIRASDIELYNEEINDLLDNPKTEKKCDIREDPQKGIYITNLCDVVVESEKELSDLLDKGLSCRTVAATLMNSESSRSHSIFTIVIEMSTKDPLSGKDHIKAGKLNLVDLAGSERQKKTGATGAQLKEGTKINLSLSALGNVISALSENKGKHIPYRDSKLTRLLQDSLGGNTKTLMIAAISPADYNYDETLSTLRYANRAKNIKNKPKINEDPKDAMLREFKEEIERLRQALQQQQSGGGGAVAAPSAVPQGGGWDFAGLVQGAAAAPNSDAMALQEALKAREQEIEKERKLREEYMLRLQELQNKFVGHHDNSNDINIVGIIPIEKSEKDIELAEQERAEAEKRLKERRQRNKEKRQRRQQAELDQILQEKQAMEEELTELKNSTDEAAIDKRIKKVKKHYEKKIQAIKNELDDAKEEFYFQRQNLVENLQEQEKDIKLYEQICKAAIPEKELKKLLEKSRWNEEEYEWILPFIKKKENVIQSMQSVNSAPNLSSSVVSSSLPSISSSSSSLLPSIGVSNNNKGGYGVPEKPQKASKSSYNPLDDDDLCIIGKGSNEYLPINFENNNSLDRIDIPIGNEKKKKKKKKKVDPMAQLQHLPYDNNPGEIGSGINAGEIGDWGFAYNDGNIAPVDSEPEYEDDDFEDDDEPPSNNNKVEIKKQKKSKVNGFQ